MRLRPASTAGTTPARSRDALRRRLTALRERAILLVALALQHVEQRARLPAEVAARDRARHLRIEERILEMADRDEREHLLADTDRAALEPDHIAADLRAGLRQLDEDVLGHRRVRIHRLARLVHVRDLDRVAVDHALPLGAVADEHDLLAGLRGNLAVVRAEHDVQVRHLLVGLLVEHAQDLARFLDRAGAPAPAVVAVLGLRSRPGVRRDVRALEVLLAPDQADLGAIRALLRLLERDVARDVDVAQIRRAEAVRLREPDVIDGVGIEADDVAAHGAERD